jgi:hypothetical protein
MRPSRRGPHLGCALVRTTTGGAALRLAPVVWSTILAVLMLGGALGPGFVLAYDMVWVPDLAVRGDFLGLGSSLPRAVPSDMVVALLDEVVPGMVLQKLVLVGTLVAAGTGAWRLMGRAGALAGVAASTLYVWNPFVVERLGIGHWPLLMTYAALPWIHLHARRVAAGERSLPQLVLWLAFASLSPAGGIVAGLYAVAGVAAQGRTAVRAATRTVGAVVAVNAPWIAAGALHGAGAVSDPARRPRRAGRPHPGRDLERRGGSDVPHDLGRRRRPRPGAGRLRRGRAVVAAGDQPPGPMGDAGAGGPRTGPRAGRGGGTRRRRVGRRPRPGRGTGA